ncbi:MAG: hypothetical protein JWN34_494 [Bryobacterales bacterium]|nr:hypothetical protein [Bryobacterales bacterium]
METRNHIFAAYEDQRQASEAVDRLLAAGFSGREITVLLRDNSASLEFARMKGTRVPTGADKAPQEDEAEGSLGILYPGEGPKRGVLDDALDGMGVPPDWPHGISQGNVLISVETDAAEKAKSVLEAGARQTGTATRPSTAA